MRMVHAVAALSVVSAVALLSGCSAVETAGTNSTETPAAPSPDPLDEHWPDGASADTPRCVYASAAVVAAVNATITTPRPGEGDSVDDLRAHPDPDAAVWILTGHISAGIGATVEVAWATTADPTSPTFEGALRSVGPAAATISDAPALSLVVDHPDGSGIPEDSCH